MPWNRWVVGPAVVVAALLFPRFAIGAAAPAATQPSVAQLQCEWRENPAEIDNAHPRLRWIMQSTEPAAAQAAWQVLVASSDQQLAADAGDLWNSGWVDSPDNHVEYAGKPLASLQQCVWKVRVRDQAGHESPWSAAAQWQMGLLHESDWKAQWIAATAASAPATAPFKAAPQAAMPIFRHQWTFTKPLARATITLCGLGQFELHVNGSKVGHDLLQPGWTDYAKTDLYVTYDVTNLLRPGGNAVGVMLGGGMYDVHGSKQRYAKFRHSAQPMLIAQINLTYADGSSAVIGTDESWKTMPGPITFSSIYGGEDFDALRQKQLRGWDAPGFDDSMWTPAVRTSGPGGQLRGSSRSAPPLRVAQVLPGKLLSQPKPGVWVYDFGQNCALFPRITVRGPAGSRVKLIPAELLNAAGLADQRSFGGGPVYFTYTLSGDGDETWMPRFTYVGCRYLQVEATAAAAGGDASLPTVLSAAGCFITTTAPAVGQFSCSNELFNRTYRLIRWAQRSNLVSVITDCPHRERLGWLEQDYLNGDALMDNFYLPAVFEKVAGDMADAQHTNGLVPDIAPEYTAFKGGFLDSPEWGSAVLLVPWQTYRWYGDKQILANEYDTMKRYVAYLGTRADEKGLLNYGLGDWYDVGPRRPGVAQLTPVALTATAFYCHDLDVLSQVARALGRDADAIRFAQQRDERVKQFNQAFYHPDQYSYATGSQTANAIALAFNFAPAADRPFILDHVVEDVRQHGNAATAGDVGYRYVLEALASGGRSDLIFDINSQSDRPGYGYQLAHGATALTEAWNADPRSSQDHFMLGHLTEWFYADLAGITQEADSVGFERIRIRPQVVGNITEARASLDSVRGEILSSWEKTADGGLELNVTIPPGPPAMVEVPAEGQVKVEGNPAGVRPVGKNAGATDFEVPAGTYQFEATR